MRDQGIWSIGLGRWNGVRARLHMFFLLFAAFTIYLGWEDWQNGGSEAWVAPVLVLILLASVVCHEIGHVIVARRLGGHVDEVVLGPLGGLASIPNSTDPQSELVAVVAGPLMNLGICLLAALALAMQTDVDLVALMDPLSPAEITSGASLVVVGLKLVFWVNWTLVLVNLIPAFPFDGGRALKAGILSFRPDMDRRAAVLMVARVAKLTALGLVIIAWLVRHEPTTVVATWFALVLLAIFVFFSARRAEVADEPSGEDAFFGYDFSEGYTSLEKSGPKCSTKPRQGPLVGWFENRRRMKERVRRQIDAEEDGRVDEILTQVHQQGMESLSAEDRAILNRASHRYRSRLH